VLSLLYSCSSLLFWFALLLCICRQGKPHSAGCWGEINIWHHRCYQTISR